ncbi:MAG: VTT domain-containing protein [Clostridia bacterium]|nr:VTT domain-containing protein [Clostridia bacterium]
MPEPIYDFSSGTSKKSGAESHATRASVEKEKKLDRNRRVIRVFGYLCYGGVAFLLVWNQIIKLDSLKFHYISYVIALTFFEQKIYSLGNKALIAFLLYFFMFVRCFIPVLPLLVFYIISGMVYPLPLAMFINVSGTVMMMAVKYYYGRYQSPLLYDKLLRRIPAVTSALENQEKPNPWLLIIFRLAPIFPFNTISQIYGSIGFPFFKYMILSLVGYLPRLISYAIMGSHFNDPFSGKFLTPLITLLLLSGSAMLVFDTLTSFLAKKSDKKKQAAVSSTAVG